MQLCRDLIVSIKLSHLQSWLDYASTTGRRYRKRCFLNCSPLLQYRMHRIDIELHLLDMPTPSVIQIQTRETMRIAGYAAKSRVRDSIRTQTWRRLN